MMDEMRASVGLRKLTNGVLAITSHGIWRISAADLEQSAECNADSPMELVPNGRYNS